MFVDTTKLRNVVDLRSVIILIRKIQSFYIESRTEFWKEVLESKIPEKIKTAKEDIDMYWRIHMQDIFSGLEKNGYIVELDGSKINIKQYENNKNTERCSHQSS